ncbi:MAG: ABC transporter permease [Ktedonobacterales bacterium]
MLSNLPVILFGIGVLAFMVITGIRVGINFLIRRLASLVFVTLGVSFITFMLGYFAPGDVVLLQLGQHYNPVLAAQLRHFYGLDLPWYAQYGRYLGGLLHFDLGFSWVDESKSVSEILSLYLPASIELGVGGTILSIVLGVPLGVWTAVRASSWFDTTTQFIALVAYVLPIFVIIPLYDVATVYLHNLGLPTLAVAGWGTWDTELAPIIIFAVDSFGYYVRFTRSVLMEELSRDYVRTARAKGLSESAVVWRHAFRNTLIPLLTAVGPELGSVVSGLFIIESLMNIPGIGFEGLVAITSHDVPLIQGTVIVLAASIVFANLVTDVAYGFADPRVKSN